MKKVLFASAAALMLAASGSAFASTAGVCDRAYEDAADRVNVDMNRWATSIQNGGFPPALRDAYLAVIAHTRSMSLAAADQGRNDCAGEFAGPQEVMNVAVAAMSFGLSEMLPGKTAYVDVSEILSGYPLGGPEALVPKLREQLLGGGRGTGANIIRDPIKCLTFQRKC